MKLPIHHLLALIIATLLLTACEKKEPVATAAGPVKVKVESIEPQEVVQSATLVGRLDSRKAVSLYPKIDGSVTSILVTPGQQVKAGQLLLEIDSTKQKAAVSTKNSEVATQKADYQKEVARLEALKAEKEAAQASADYNKHEFERNYWLEQRGVVSEATVDGFDRQYKVAEAHLKEIAENIKAQKDVIARSARAVEAATYARKEQEEQLAYYRITAPFAGVMADIPVKLGDYVNSSTKLTTVSQVRPLEVNVLVPKEMAPGLHVGMPLDLIDDSGKTIAQCSVFHVDPIVDRQNQSVLVKALFDNSGEQFRPDQSVTTKLVLNQQQGILVPTDALSFIAGKAFAYVVNNGNTVQQRPLEIYSIQGNRVAIKSGVQSGDRVVTSGVQNLRDGATVSIE